MHVAINQPHTYNTKVEDKGLVSQTQILIHHCTFRYKIWRIIPTFNFTEEAKMQMKETRQQKKSFSFGWLKHNHRHNTIIHFTSLTGTIRKVPFCDKKQISLPNNPIHNYHFHKRKLQFITQKTLILKYFVSSLQRGLLSWIWSGKQTELTAICSLLTFSGEILHTVWLFFNICLWVCSLHHSWFVGWGFGGNLHI